VVDAWMSVSSSHGMNAMQTAILDMCMAKIPDTCTELCIFPAAHVLIQGKVLVEVGVCPR